MFFKNQTISGGLAVPPCPPSWKILPKVQGIINETVPKCFTLQLRNTSLGTDSFRDNIHFLLDPLADWIILLHDPAYYLLVLNTMVTPGIRLSYKAPPAGEWRMPYIRLTEHLRINRADQPCQEDQNYRFRKQESH